VPRIALAVVGLLTALLSSGLTDPPAHAGSYSVRQCDWAAGNGHHDFVWHAAGQPTVDVHAGSGCGEFGLALRNGGGGTQRTYPSGAYGGWFAYAPPGTVITRFAGAFGALQGCCVSGMTGYGEATERPDGQGGRSYLFQGHLGDATWYAPSGLNGPVGRSWSAAASGFDARRVGFQLRCGPGFSCNQSVYADLRLRGRSFDFTVRDDVAPAIGAPAGSLLAGGWRRGVQSLALAAGDTGGGLAVLEAEVDDGTVLRQPSECVTAGGHYARLAPCPAARTVGWQLDSARLPDGARTVELRATDAGGATTRRTASFAVDNSAPAAPRELTLGGGDGWRRGPFDLSWVAPGGQHAPIALARWRICPAAAAFAGPGCVEGERPVGGPAAVAPPAAGEWDARLWLVDAAGNADPAAASDPLRLRYDPDPPALRLLPGDPQAPARFAAIADDLSGIADAAFELRRAGSERWVALSTERHGELLTAGLGRDRAGGAYDVRVRATDRAGNVGVAYGGTRLVDSGPTTGGGARRLRRPRARVTMAARRARTRDSASRRTAAPRRRARDRRRGRARSPRWGPRQRRLSVAGGRPVRFEGRVGRPVPRQGKLVEVQAHFRGRWRTISTVRARRDGRWRFRYVFRTTGQPAGYRLRARVPVEAGYPFSAGRSRPVRVTVLPQRR
jgi:hypothetical protein